MDEDEKLPFHKKDLVPKDRLDRGLFLFMSAGIPSLAIWETVVILHYHPDIDSVAWTLIALELFLLVNIIGNLYYFKRIDTTGKQRSLPVILKPGWRYCHFCQLNSPPRSHHCPVCDECILKRDRHCMFAGCCVGFHNQRYYFLALFYGLIGALTCFLYQWPYFLEINGGFSIGTFLKLIAPHIAVVTGFLSVYGFIVTVSQIILFLFSGLTSYLLYQQLVCIFNGQTTQERAKNITSYDLGVYRNFVEVLGKQWFLALLLPFFASRLPGDGLYFLTLNELEDIKDV